MSIGFSQFKDRFFLFLLHRPEPCLPPEAQIRIGSVFLPAQVKIAVYPRKEVNEMSSNQGSNSNRVTVPEARAALNNMKYEIARELGINLRQGDNGDLTARENGYVGGYMVKQLIKQAEQQMAGQNGGMGN